MAHEAGRGRKTAGVLGLGLLTAWLGFVGFVGFLFVATSGMACDGQAPGCEGRAHAILGAGAAAMITEGIVLVGTWGAFWGPGRFHRSGKVLALGTLLSLAPVIPGLVVLGHDSSSAQTFPGSLQSPEPTLPYHHEFGAIALPPGWTLLFDLSGDKGDVARDYEVRGAPTPAMQTLRAGLQAQGFEPAPAYSVGLGPCALSMTKGDRVFQAQPQAVSSGVPSESDPFGCPVENEQFIVRVFYWGPRSSETVLSTDFFDVDSIGLERWLQLNEYDPGAGLYGRIYRVKGAPARAMRTLEKGLAAQGYVRASTGRALGPCALTMVNESREFDAAPVASRFIAYTDADPYGCPGAGDAYSVTILTGPRLAPG